MCAPVIGLQNLPCSPFFPCCCEKAFTVTRKARAERGDGFGGVLLQAVAVVVVVVVVVMVVVAVLVMVRVVVVVWRTLGVVKSFHRERL